MALLAAKLGERERHLPRLLPGALPLGLDQPVPAQVMTQRILDKGFERAGRIDFFVTLFVP